MSQKKINYLARTFDDYRSELIKFSNKYYPELSDSYNDSSIGSWFIDLVASVSDNLSYHIDRMYQETNINSANLKNTVLNIARTNGLKVPGPKASMCEVQISCILPVGDDVTGSISSPKWAYAPIIKKSTVVSAGNLNFQLDEDVDFGEQFNKNGFSNRTFSPLRDSNGIITAYTVTKTALAVNGSTRIFKKVILSQDLKPFMEITLPEKNVMNIESIIFKETSNFKKDPDTQEFYIDAEQYKMSAEAAETFRFFEVNSLAEQYRFGTEANIDNGVIQDYFNPELYDDYTEGGEYDETIKNTTRYYRGKWKPITQKFITEYTDNGYMKVIFGSGVSYDTLPETKTKFSERMMSNLINNDMLGVLPREGWTMFILYRVGGGISSNIGVGAINSITLTVAEFKQNEINEENAASIRGMILNSLSVTNTSPAVAGKDAPSSEEIKYLTKYNNSSQERCITVKDYKCRLMMMPPKYGAPYRASVVEENNKIAISMLGLGADGRLTKALPETLVENIEEYMSHYKSIGDYIEGKSGKIYNIGFSIDIFVSKTYDTPTVLTNVIETIKNYMSVENHDMGEDIFLGDLEKEIMLVDGVVSIINFEVYSIYNGSYSTDRCPYPEYGQSDSDTYKSVVYNNFKVESGADSFKIDLDSIDHVLYSDYNSCFEIFNPTADIQIRAKLI
jgi:hypothetical protein